MFGSSRNERLAFAMKWGGGFATFVVCVMVTWLAAAEYGKQSGYAESQAKHSANTYSQEIENACKGFAGPELLRCRYEVRNSAADAERSGYDLQAQRDVALWTWWMMWASGFGILLTIAGLYFLAANLTEMQEGRKLTQEALDLAKRDRRAWLSIALKRGQKFFKDSGEYTGFRVDYAVERHGETPAFNVKASCFHVACDPLVAIYEASEHFAAIAMRRYGKSTPSMHPVFVGDPNGGEDFSAESLGTPEIFGQQPLEGTNKYAVIVLVYTVVGDMSLHHVLSVYSIDHTVEENTSLFLRMANSAD
jgi:hypothetical protein